MNKIPYNPFLEGSEEVPPEEAWEAAKLLTEEARRIRERAEIIKEKAAKVRSEKEAIEKEKAAQREAAIEATRAQIAQTVSNIPKLSEKVNQRPAPPPQVQQFTEESAKFGTIASSSHGWQMNPVAALGFIVDLTATAVTLIFTLLILQDILIY